MMSVQAQYNVPNLQDLIGAKGSSVEKEMESRNYEFVNTTKSGSSVYENWWHESARKCVTVRFQNGYLKSAIYAPDYDCHKSGKTYGSGIYSVIGEKASSADTDLGRMGYRYINTTSSGRTDYAHWWNDSKRKCITVRLENGVIKSVTPTQRYDCEEHDNFYTDKNKKRYHEIQYERNYDAHVSVNDLNGRNALDAYRELNDRGFQEVKKHTSNGKTYRVWYNSNTNQCIKTVSINKRIKEVLNSTHCW